MDFIINGRMKEKDHGLFYRYNGIIASHDANIVKKNEDEKDEIELYGDPNEENPLIGRIYIDPNDPPSLCIKDSNENIHRIIPTEKLEAGIDNPYEIYINYTRDPEIYSLIDIELRLNQNVYNRELNVELHSKVRLRN